MGERLFIDFLGFAFLSWAKISNLSLVETGWKKYAVGKADEIKLMGFVGWKTLDPQNRENMENNPGKKCSYFQGEKSNQYNRLDSRHSYQVFVDHGDEGMLCKFSECAKKVIKLYKTVV